VVPPAGPGRPPAPGTTAQVERIMVCPASDVSLLPSGPATCNKDWSTRGIAAGGRIYCTIEIADGTGAHVSLAFVSETSTVWQGSSFEVTGADWIQWIWYEPFPSGTYACTVSLNGSLVARLPFVVGT
jgi:hypothetical protein